MEQLELNLKQRLDEIDDRIKSEATQYLQQGRLAVLLGMWEKGKAVSDSIGIDSEVSTDNIKSTLNILIPWQYCRTFFKRYDLSQNSLFPELSE